MTLPFGLLGKQEDLRILVVDDEPFIREVVTRWLEDEGYCCTAARSADEALEALAHQPFALLLSDIHMPGKTGLELLVIARQLHPELAILMLTGVDDRRTAIRTLEAGAFGYIIKPVEPNELVINVANALERRRLLLASQNYQHRLEQEVRDRTADIRRREEELALRLVTASEWRDNETGAHIRRIGLYAAALARALGWEARAVDDIRLAASMHDVGKIGIPDTILLKPGKLTGEEFEVIKTHAEIGALMLGASDIPLLQLAAEIAHSHHEKWNGFGYPRGLAGKDIPQSARIVAVADVYDALVHERVYKPALPEQEALAIITEQRGQHFDPEVVDAFLTLVPEFRRIRETVREQQTALRPKSLNNLIHSRLPTEAPA